MKIRFYQPPSIFLDGEKRRFSIPFAASSFISFRLKIITEDKFKEKLCNYMVNGLKDEEVYKIASGFFASNSSRHFFNHELIEILKDHSTQGDKVYIVSSNFRFLLEPLKGLYLLMECMLRKQKEKKMYIREKYQVKYARRKINLRKSLI